MLPFHTVIGGVRVVRPADAHHPREVFRTMRDFLLVEGPAEANAVVDEFLHTVLGAQE